jgi:hypothetical protein
VNAQVAIATRDLNTGSAEDPGSWTISVSDDWTAYVLCIHPAPNRTANLHEPTMIGQAVMRSAVM